MNPLSLLSFGVPYTTLGLLPYLRKGTLFDADSSYIGSVMESVFNRPLKATEERDGFFQVSRHLNGNMVSFHFKEAYHGTFETIKVFVERFDFTMNSGAENTGIKGYIDLDT